MNYALLIFLIAAEIRVEAYQTMKECEIRKSEVYQKADGRARCLWIKEGKNV